MKIGVQKATKEDPKPQVEYRDLSELIEIYREKYKSIYIYQIDNQIYVYRPLGRSEFKELYMNQELSAVEKEDVICKACVLWPEDFNPDDCDAGVPTKLSKVIVQNSHMDTIDSQLMVLGYFRQEMFDLDNQINCIINEAFPQFDIEEIEKWDIARTCYYLSRAEWKLQNLRGIEMKFDPFAARQQEQTEEPKQAKQLQVETEEIGSTVEPGKVETVAERQERLTKMGGKKEKLTPEKLAELRAKYPEIYGKGEIITNMEQMKDSVDVVSPALRPGWGS